MRCSRIRARRNVYGVVITLLALAVTAYGGEDASEYSWDALFCRGLASFYEGNYTNVFAQIQDAVRHRRPASDVHRAIYLMRKSFLAMHGLREPVSQWTSSAETDIRKIARLSRDSDEDKVVLVVLRSAMDSDFQKRPENDPMPILEFLIDPQHRSLWRDWAYWEKVRLVASKTCVPTDAWGTSLVVRAGTEWVGCLSATPEQDIMARAAETFLRENPKTYMGRVMREQLFRARFEAASRALRDLEKNEWFTCLQTNDACPLSDRQIAYVSNARTNLTLFGTSMWESACRRQAMERRMDEFLLCGHLKARYEIPKYFQARKGIPDMPHLPPEVTSWLASVAAPSNASSSRLVPEDELRK